MPQPLAGRRILLGVSAGIAAYKSPDLVRRLREHGAQVRVMLTPSAQAFVGPLTFQAVSGQPVHTDLLDPAAEAAMGHIELARWADLVLIAPATADLMARLAAGLANDLLSTVVLASDRPLALAPAMNRQMWAHPATADNLRRLEARGCMVWGPGSGDQACGETGAGRMLEPADLADRVAAHFSGQGELKGLRVMVTAGPTFEDLDPVRFLANRSSGRMGYAVAEAARDAGATVTLVSGPVRLPPPAGMELVAVRTAREMSDAVMSRVAECDIFVAAAAVADFRPAEQASQKIKKTGDDSMTLTLVQNPDILRQVAALEAGPFTVGFAAETDDVAANARKKRQAKGVDMIAANQVGLDDRGFDVDQNALTVIWSGGSETLDLQRKPQLARALVRLIAQRRMEKDT